MKRKANRVRFLIQDSYIIHGDQKLNVTISIGATLAKAEDTTESLLKRADELLYQSKSDGRNRVTVG
jgi:diguanylate cyclase (GGDEF)-like protein